MILTIILWALVIIVGLPMFLIALGLFLGRFAVEINDSIDGIEFLEGEPEDIQGLPAKRMRKLAEEVDALGYRKVSGYSVPKMAATGARNFVFAYLAPDEGSYAEVYYLRAPWIFRLITLVFDRRHFHHSLLNVCFVSAWADGSRLQTARDISVVVDTHENDQSQLLPSLNAAALLKAHQEKLKALEKQRGPARAFCSIEDYQAFIRERSRAVHASGPQSIEDVFNCESPQ